MLKEVTLKEALNYNGSAYAVTAKRDRIVPISEVGKNDHFLIGSPMKEVSIKEAFNFEGEPGAVYISASCQEIHPLSEYASDCHYLVDETAPVKAGKKTAAKAETKADMFDDYDGEEETELFGEAE